MFRPGVDFIKVACTAQIIEIALTVHLHLYNYAQLLRRYFAVQKFGVGRKTAYEIDPWTEHAIICELKNKYYEISK